MEKRKKEFDAVEWVRSVRDANYIRLGHLPIEQYIRTLSEEGANSALAKELKDKPARLKKKQ